MLVAVAVEVDRGVDGEVECAGTPGVPEMGLGELNDLRGAECLLVAGIGTGRLCGCDCDDGEGVRAGANTGGFARGEDRRDEAVVSVFGFGIFAEEDESS